MGRPDHPVFNPQKAVQCFCELYETMLQRPLVSPAPISAGEINKIDRHKTTNGLQPPKMKVRGVNAYAPFGRKETTPAIAS